MTGWLPIRRPLNIPGIRVPGDFDAALDDIVAGFPSAFAAFDSSIASIAVARADPPESIVDELARLNGARWLGADRTDFLRIDAIAAFDFASWEPATTEARAREMIPSLGALALASVVPDVFLLAELVYPALVSPSTGGVWIDDAFVGEISRFVGVPSEAVGDLALVWPPLVPLSLADVVSWETQLGLFRDGFGRTPVQRALASFTRVLGMGSVEPYEILFWSMQGLEAFYCRGNGSLRQQLSEKSSLFLGPWDDPKNLVGRLYDFRSKFVHGCFTVERWNNDGWEDSDIDEQQVACDSAMLAVRLLLVTLQKCARDKVTGINYTWLIETEHAQQALAQQ